MKKIIIVGHNQENNEKLETLFQHFGMKKALPSRREGLTPIQVGELLSKAIKSQAPQIQEIDEEELPKKLPTPISKRRLKKNLKKQQNTQVASALPKSMWDYIPMDLMIANIDSEFWGWADKNALENLEYWKNLDPSIYFVLTYEQPQSLLLKLESENEEISKEIILEKLDDWNTYNTKMLDFFEKNPERAILINNEIIKQQNKNSIKTIYNKIIPNELIEQNKFNIIESSDEKYDFTSSIDMIVVNNIISACPEIVTLYEKLQTVANLPFFENNQSVEHNLDQLINFWSEKKLQKEKINNLILYNEAINIENQNNERKLLLANKEKENLLSQIFIIQENLEKMHNSNLDLLEKNSDFNKKNKNLSENLSKKDKELSFLTKSNTELNKNNEELKEKINAITSEKNSLLAQLYLVQDELEKLFLNSSTFHGELENEDNKQPQLFGAPDIVRNHLKYKLGAMMIKNGKNISGVLKLPSMLMNCYKLEYPFEKDMDLLNIERYIDYHEAERIKKHLSYRLGDLFIKNVNNPMKWFILPFKIFKEVSDFRKK